MTTEGQALLSRLAGIAEAMSAVSPPQVRDELAQVRARLARPLTIVVAGRVSSGKSTLVNALLHRRVALTGEGETTRRIVHYRYGPGEGVSVVLRSGRMVELDRWVLPLDGALTLPPGIESFEVERVEVSLQTSRLSNISLIDTPGLQSLTTGGGGAAGSILDEADALFFLLSDDLRSDDLEALDEFLRTNRDEITVANRVIVVLNRCDEIGGPDSTWCRQVVDGIRVRLGGRCRSVIPVVAVVAEAANGDGLRDERVRHLIDLGRTRPQAAHDPVDIQEFVEDSPIGRSAGLDLIELLGPWGLERAIAALRAEPSTTALRNHLAELSGVGRVDAELERLRARSEVVKLRRASAALLSISRRSLPRFVNELQDLMATPYSYVLDEIEVLDLVDEWGDMTRAGFVRSLLSPGSLDDRLGRCRIVDRGDLTDQIDEWRGFENTAPTARDRYIGGVVARRLCAMWVEVIDGGR